MTRVKCSREKTVESRERNSFTSDHNHRSDDSGNGIRVAAAVTAADVEGCGLECNQQNYQTDTEHSLYHVVPHYTHTHIPHLCTFKPEKLTYTLNN